MKNINVKYKLLMTIPLFMLMGCSRHYKNHWCVVQNVSSNKIQVKDIKKNKDKIIEVNTVSQQYLKFVCPKDTIVFSTRNSRTENLYNTHSVVYAPAHGYVCVNGDSLDARQDRLFYNQQLCAMLAEAKERQK